MNRQPIIVGIDPGNTLAYAVMDINGNIIAVKSAKQVKINELIDELILYGNIVVVASDVRPAGSFVRKVAKRLGARLIQPEDKLKIKDKKRLASKSFLGKSSQKRAEYRNVHERDALAASVYAYKRIRSLLAKVDKSFSLEKKISEKKEEVKKLVLTKKGMSIARALDKTMVSYQ